MKAYRIDGFTVEKEESSFRTRFGGQPDWISEPQWPVSPAWGDRPMKFIGQIRLNDFYKELRDTQLAYIFLTQPDNAEDDFYDPDIIFPDEGENAVIIQPCGEIPEYIHVREHRTGPTADENIWVPQITGTEEFLTDEFKDIDIDKFCGIPALFPRAMSQSPRNFNSLDLDECRQGPIPRSLLQGIGLRDSEMWEKHSLLLQLHTRWLPFYVNAGGAPTLFTFLNERRDMGFIMIEDI